MRMNLKKIFVLIICIIIQVTYIVSANEDATQSFGYQNIMHEVRQRNAGVQPIPTQPVTPLATPVAMPVPTPIPTTITPQGLVVPNSIVIPPIHPTQHPTITMHTYTTERQNMYGEIVESYNKLSKDKDNKNLCANYINSVENYRNTYGDILLKSENRDNYFQIMQRLGLAYKNTSRIDDAIDTYENLLKENPTNINIKKHLLVLYDEATSCIDAENMLSQIKLYEPSYNMNFKNCSDNIVSQTTNTIPRYQSNETHRQEQEPTPKDNYNWDMVYLTYFGLWILVFIIWGNIDKFDLHNKENKTFNYQIKYDYNNTPIKPDIYEFGFDKDSYDEIIQKINNAGNFDAYDYLMAPISMYIITQIFVAPTILFPIFRLGWGLIAGIIFYVLSIFAVNKIKNKLILLKLDSSVKNYNNYISAIKLYDEAKSKYDKELKRIEEEKRKAKERERWKQKDYWYNLDPFEFEEKIGELFRNLGYNVAVTKKSGDGGIDVLIKKGHNTIGVQCKRYKDKVGAKEVRELWAVKDYFKLNGKVQKIDRVIMIALSGVSKPAYEFIQQFPEYELWTINTILAKANEVNYSYKN